MLLAREGGTILPEPNMLQFESQPNPPGGRENPVSACFSLLHERDTPDSSTHLVLPKGENLEATVKFTVQE